MKKTLLIKLHLYTGIFTSCYLLAFGTSSLILNHKWNVEQKELVKSWEKAISVDAELADLQLAEEIRDELDIMGWLPRWQFHREKELFSFRITHPGREYRLRHNARLGNVQVKEYPKGFIAVFHGLHFLNGNIPNAPLLIRSWAVYQWLALSAMLISLILGVWLWIKYSYRTWQGVMFGGLFLGMLILMIMV